MSQRIKNKQLLVSSDFDINSQKLVNVALPEFDQDAANKFYVDNAFNDIFEVTGEPTGFPQYADTTSTLSVTGNQISITPTGSSFYYYIAGERFESTGATHTITNTEGTKFYYFNIDGEFHEYLSFNESLIFDHAYVAAVYWDVSGAKALYVGNERHGFIMDGVTHQYLHSTFGTQYGSGLAVSTVNPVNGTGDVDGDAQILIEDGRIYDEDLPATILDDDPQNLRPILNTPIYYRSGANLWEKEDASAFPVLTGGTGRLAYNEFTGGVWVQTEIAQSDFVNCHIFATNDIYNPIIAIQGQTDYLTAGAARTGANNEINELVVDGMTFQEFTPIATIIYQTNNSYTNTVHARIRSTDEGDDLIDWRGTKVSPGVSPSSHSSLTDLSVDTHFQYALLDGRSGDILKIDTISGFTNGTVSFDNNRIIGVLTPVDDTDAANKKYVDDTVDALTYSTDINLTALSGTGGTYLATNTSVSDVPVTNIRVMVNSIEVNVGNGTTVADCFFSDDGGSTAKSFTTVAQGDNLYWNGDQAKYQLEITDEIDFIYLTR